MCVYSKLQTTFTTKPARLPSPRALAKFVAATAACEAEPMRTLLTTQRAMQQDEPPVLVGAIEFIHQVNVIYDWGADSC